MLNSITVVDKLRFLVHMAGTRLNAADIRCGIIIVDYFNTKKGKAWPSYARIAASTNLSRATVARAVAKLHRIGIIDRSGGHKGRSNSYVPAFNLLPLETDVQSAQITSVGPTRTETVVTPSQPRDLNDLNVETTSVSATRPNPSTTPRSNQRRGSSSTLAGRAATAYAAAAGGASSWRISATAREAREEDGSNEFGSFWEAYPKKEGRRAAERAYAGALARGAASKVLCEKAAQYAAAKAHLSNQQYVKMPANWLRDECWLEDPQPPRPKGRLSESGGSPARNHTGKKSKKAARKEKAIREEVKAELKAEQLEKEGARLARIKASRSRKLVEMPAKRENQRLANAAKSLARREAENINPDTQQICGASRNAPVPLEQKAPENPATLPTVEASTKSSLNDTDANKWKTFEEDLDTYRLALGMIA
jgi:biotin operon repressor